MFRNAKKALTGKIQTDIFTAIFGGMQQVS
jgi:hypothetical protein